MTALRHAALLATLLSGRLLAQGTDSLPPRPVSPPDPRTWVGERLEYEAKTGPFGLGTAELQVAGVDTDVRRYADCERLLGTAIDRFGGAEILVASAGVTREDFFPPSS